MTSSDRADLQLLRSTLPIFLDVTRFYTTGDERAIKARRALNKKHSRGRASHILHHGKPIVREKAFHASLWADLKILSEVLHGAAEPPLARMHDISEATSALLQLLDEDFVSSSDVASLTSEGSGEYGEGHYVQLRRLLGLFETQHDKLDDDGRLEWTLKRTSFGRPTIGAQKRITEHVRSCRRALNPLTRGNAGSKLPQEPFQFRPWPGAETICRNMEYMHRCLARDWLCKCKSSHKRALFSFESTGQMIRDSLLCRLVYPSKKSHSGWRCARIQLMLGNDATIASQYKLDALCDDLEGITEQRSTNPRQSSSSGHHVDNHGDCEAPVALEKPEILEKTPIKKRLTLALLLSYLYLHLSGGPLWPYELTENHAWARHVWARKLDESGEWEVISRILLPSNSTDDKQRAVPYHLRSANSHMPSLPYFGKMLLEIITSRSVHWLKIDEAKRAYEDEAFAEQIIGAMNACLSDGDSTFKTGQTIRDSEQMRIEFTTRVIGRLHYALTAGYTVDIAKVLREASFRPYNGGGRSQRGASEAEQQGDRAAPLEKDYSPNVYCLHDDGEKESLKKEHVRSASLWLEKLQKSVRKYSQHTSDSGQTPVRIAVIDTGARFDQSLDLQFDDRFKECRSWLDADKGSEGVRLERGGDEDGHGTHTTSLVLKATEHTACQVYAAQVFRNRGDTQTTESTKATQTAIAWAIRYAVEFWHVNIISMSFGFAESVDIISSEILNAYSKNVLMFAAASNGAGNSITSWPARHENVISIYATNGYGNKYKKNPPQMEGRHNFALLGSSVEGCWPPGFNGGRETRYRSGTSVATPIAAGIAGVLMYIMRREMRTYLEYSRRRKGLNQEQYEKKLLGLATPRGMSTVFKVMSHERDGYDYVTPWELLESDDGLDVVRGILKQLRKC